MKQQWSKTWSRRREQELVDCSWSGSAIEVSKEEKAGDRISYLSQIFVKAEVLGAGLRVRVLCGEESRHASTGGAND